MDLLGIVEITAVQAYPAFNVVEGNHVANVGVWNKQSAAFFKVQ